MDLSNTFVRALKHPEGDPVRDRTEERILDAALTQFEQSGLVGTTMADISRQSRLARITLYRHFPSKQDLVEAVLCRQTGLFLAELLAKSSGYSRAEDRVTEGFLFTLEFIRNHTLLNRLIEGEPELFLPALTVQASELVRVVTDFFAAQLARNPGEKRDPAQLLMIAELTTRLHFSFLLTPEGRITLADPDTARAFAQQCLVPLILGR